MTEYCDFTQQDQTIDSNGNPLKPDMIVRLPGGRNVVVDAKVTSAAYLDAMEADNDTVRDGKLRDHARQVRDHIVRLGNKGYLQHFQPTPDLVIMCVPGETLLSVAMQRDPALLEFSLGRGVRLASPLTLMALLRAVDHDRIREIRAAKPRLASIPSRATSAGNLIVAGSSKPPSPTMHASTYSSARSIRTRPTSGPTRSSRCSRERSGRWVRTLS